MSMKNLPCGTVEDVNYEWWPGAVENAAVVEGRVWSGEKIEIQYK